MTGRRLALGVLAAATMLTSCGGVEETFAGIVRDQERAGVTLKVASCRTDPVSTVTEAIVEIASEKEYGTILFNVDLMDTQGTVVGQGSTSVRNVKPGKTYQARVVLSIASGQPPPNPKCEVSLEFASRM